LEIKVSTLELTVWPGKATDLLKYVQKGIMKVLVFKRNNYVSDI